MRARNAARPHALEAVTSVPSERTQLREYRRKRDFSQTPEPAASRRSKARSKAHRFVVQMHRASHLHFDFRLEAGGTLKSWAVPKGPSMDPADKRLAMHVEDHPLDYAGFEGTIPEGNYGAGEVIVWDNGTYETLDGSDPAKSIAAGSIKFTMNGKKLRGAFALVKMRGRNNENNAWLLIKERDRYAKSGGKRDDRSVLTKRTLDDVAEDPRAKHWQSNRPAASRSRRKPPAAQLVTISRPDKVLFPEDGFTKADLAGYYDAVSQWMLPHIADRPLTLERFPDGIHGMRFFGKDLPGGAPDWLQREAIKGADGRVTRYIICNDRRTLSFAANLAAITLHVWTSRIDALDQPDYVFFDLDPCSSAGLGRLARVALGLRELLGGIGLEPLVKTSGGSGLHVIVPLRPEFDYDVVKSFGELVARKLKGELPDDVTLERSVAKRPKAAIYFDYVQIGRGKTIVAPYTVRARPGAPVSMPLEWKVVAAWTDSRAKSALAVFREWTIETVPGLLRKRGDVWRGAFDRPRGLESALKTAQKKW
jgi:bifunctional non-homologous end joining protein LigD